VVQAYRDRAAVEAPYELPPPSRGPAAVPLGGFCHRRSRELTDTLVDLLLDLIHRIGAKAERKVEKALLDDFKRVSWENWHALSRGGGHAGAAHGRGARTWCSPS